MPCQPTDPCYQCTDCNNLTAPCVDVCPTPIYTELNCLNPVDDKCVSYTGVDDVCFTIVKPVKQNVIIDKILFYIKNIFSKITSSSLLITRTGGTCNNTATIELVPSIDVNNILKLGVDGKPFVPNIKIADNGCITFTKTIVNNEIIYTPTINTACLAALLCPICGIVGPTCNAPTNLTTS